MQHDLLGLPNDLRLNLELDLLRSKSVVFDASQRHKDVGAIADSLSFLLQKLFIKTVFAQNGYFEDFDLSGLNC